jgi:calcium-dependent protein kinase
MESKEGDSDSEIRIQKKSLIEMQEDLITDHYDISEQELGVGSYGFVKTGINKTTKEPRAIKYILKQRIRKMERFKSEYETMRHLDHPNICKLFEWYEDSVYIYLVMELCEGGELLDLILKERNLSEKKAARYMKQILISINHCHDQGIAHRDLKPENLLLQSKDSQSTLKLIDFGFAKIFKECAPPASLHKMHSRIGTPFYISPEVIQGNYDQSCDLWSAGVLLFVILSGTVPFFGKTDGQIIEKVQIGEFEFLDPIWEEISDEAKDLICKLLTKPAERLTAQQALEHPWIKNLAENSDVSFSSNHITMLKSYKESQKLKKTVLQYIATQMASKDLEELNEIFRSLDKTNNGKLSFEEFKNGLSMIKDKEEIKEIFKQVDINKSGFIDYSEFIAATMTREQFAKRDLLLEAFNHFDKVIQYIRLRVLIYL